MGFESFSVPPAEKPEENAFLDERGVEQAFTKEGVLNRNFGKNVEQPSEALFYKGGILNRSKFNEIIRGENDKQTEAVEDQKLSETLPDEKVESLPAEESSHVETIPTAEPSLEVPVGLGSSSEKLKPIMAQLVESHQSEADPEKAAFDALYSRLDLNLSTEDKLAKMREFVGEFEKFKEGK